MKLAIGLLLGVFVSNEGLAQATTRIEQLNNDKVTVWKTLVYPSDQQKLPMHRHEHDRVVVALTDGEFKITNDQGKIHYWKLEKNKAYYLARDPVDELHNDENISNHVIKVMVIELKN
ncbi:hypothetical protein [Legionella sp. km772]|uniref:hypothetical protein n=1 Tax=Legionella sp. km772 TaxID=2498111 RepID=UPI001F1F5D7F|nr:hypothetical protein [Legionella sp. km772]